MRVMDEMYLRFSARADACTSLPLKTAYFAGIELRMGFTGAP